MTEATMNSKPAVQLNRHFQKSVRIDCDLQSAQALEGYVSQPSCLNLLQIMSRAMAEERNSAFTWTGPYGSGKSSLALVFSALLSPRRDLQHKAKELLHLDGSAQDYVSKVFCSRRRWQVIDLVGTDRPLREALLEALINRNLAKEGDDPLQALREHTDARHGIAVIIDEMGAFLLNALRRNSMMFVQELAETAARSHGALMVTGILHQSFDAYVSGLSQEVRNEWSKVQGRFDNYVFAPSVFETIALLAGSLKHEAPLQSLPEGTAELMQQTFRQNEELEHSLLANLQGCLPLHPVTVLLLCALARRSYGQNERSIFSFLSSLEPYALQDYLSKAGSEALYTPACLFDYVRANVNPMLMQSSDLHQWELALSCVSAAERTLGPDEVALLKTIALTEIYGKYSGLEANETLLRCCLISAEQSRAEQSRAEQSRAEQSLRRLLDANLILHKAYAGTYSLFAGSDFNFDREFAKVYARTVPDFSCIQDFLRDSERLIAKKHFIQTGTLRWFDILSVPDEQLSDIITRTDSRNDCAGKLVVVYLLHADKEAEVRSQIEQCQALNLLFCLRTDSAEVAGLCRSVRTLQTLQQDPRLQGDAVARQEIASRLRDTLQLLQNKVEGSYLSSELYHQGRKIVLHTAAQLSSLLSELCGRIFPEALPLNNELINRNKISPNISAARRILLTAMTEKADLPRLGIAGTPAEFCLYNSLFADTGIHSLHQADSTEAEEAEQQAAEPVPVYAFEPLSEQVSAPYRDFFAGTCAFIRERGQVTATEVFDFWSAPPYGLKKGPQPLLLLALLLGCEDSLACYVNKIFMTTLAGTFTDELNVSPERISIRWYGEDAQHQAILQQVQNALQQVGARMPAERKPLAVARALVRFVLTLPKLTQRTLKVSLQTQQLKTAVVNAFDPLNLLFDKLPQLFPGLTEDGSALQHSLQELRDFYDGQLHELQDLLFVTIRHNPEDDIHLLSERAENLRHTTGSNRLEQFAGKIALIADRPRMCLEGIISLCAEKPFMQWTDKEVDTLKSA